MAFSSKNTVVKEKGVFPREFLELRFWSFVLLALIAIYLMTTFAVTKPVDGLTDPFYSPTILVLPLVAGFRATCYAYRKDYHRHLFRHPVACGVVNFNRGKKDLPGEKLGRKYFGETGIFRIENLHRWFWYTAVAILPFFYYDIYVALSYQGTLTLGGLLLILNTLWVTLYTFSCHFFRHVTGGNVDCYSCPVNKRSFRRGFFRGVSRLNEGHEHLAWLSLASFFLVDLYIRGVAAGLHINILLLRL
ncbi:succinate dehydrogenase [Caldiplasma sukawensis]